MQLVCGEQALDLTRPRVMGVVNVTPDSFSDGGKYLRPSHAIAQATKLVEEGADVIDLGAESTRPGSEGIDAKEERRRLAPVLSQLVKELPVPISVDTSKPAVMEFSVDQGAALINDVNGLRAEGAVQTIAKLNSGICIMHMLGEPRTMQQSPHYDDVVKDVRQFLRERVAACTDAGIDSRRLMIDPGFGFGKTVQDNLRLLRQLSELRSLGLPILAGLSRKSLLGALTGRDVDERLPGSLGLAWAALSGGARLLRVHDVAATVDLIRVWQAIHSDATHAQGGADKSTYN